MIQYMMPSEYYREDWQTRQCLTSSRSLLAKFLSSKKKNNVCVCWDHAESFRLMLFDTENVDGGNGNNYLSRIAQQVGKHSTKVVLSGAFESYEVIL